MSSIYLQAGKVFNETPTFLTVIDQTDFGDNLGIGMITGSTGGIITVAGEATAKLAGGVVGN